MAVKMKLEQIGEVYAITASIEDFERIFATHKAECVGEILDKAFSWASSQIASESTNTFAKSEPTRVEEMDSNDETDPHTTVEGDFIIEDETPKKKRKRRTKAEMEAARAAESAKSEDTDVSEPEEVLDDSTVESIEVETFEVESIEVNPIAEDTETTSTTIPSVSLEDAIANATPADIPLAGVEDETKEKDWGSVCVSILRYRNMPLSEIAKTADGMNAIKRLTTFSLAPISEREAAKKYLEQLEKNGG